MKKSHFEPHFLLQLNLPSLSLSQIPAGQSCYPLDKARNRPATTGVRNVVRPVPDRRTSAWRHSR